MDLSDASVSSCRLLLLRSVSHQRPACRLPEQPGGDTLTPEQEHSWRTRGFCLVDGVWPAELIAQAAAGLAAGEGLGMGEGQEFPSDLGTINDVTLHPRLLRAVAQLLQTEETELRLQESSAWGKAR